MQLVVFARVLKGTPDKLLNYRIKQLDLIGEDGVICSYPAAVFTDNANDQISGIAFHLTERELLQADIYETNAYKRVQVQLVSGKTAWVFISGS